MNKSIEMAHLIKDHAFHRSYSVPLFIHEPNDDRTPMSAETTTKPLSNCADNLGEFPFYNIRKSFV